MHDWDDLRFFLAVARTGSVTEAAARLGVNQSTVSRRINSFEEEINVRLFERLSTGYVLTLEGNELLRRSERIEEETHAIDRHLMGKNIELSGPIRVTCSLVMGQYFVIPLLKRFHKKHPGIEIYLDMSNSLYNLTNREADVAIRVTRDVLPESLIGRELGRVDYGVYGEKKYLRTYYEGDHALQWIGEDNNQTHPNWLPKTLSPLRLIMRTNDVLATVEILKQGLGIGRLPCFIGDKESRLEKMEISHTIPFMPVWLLTHTDLRRVNKVSVFTAFMVEELRTQLGYQ